MFDREEAISECVFNTFYFVLDLTSYDNCCDPEMFRKIADRPVLYFGPNSTLMGLHQFNLDLPYYYILKDFCNNFMPIRNKLSEERCIELYDKILKLIKGLSQKYTPNRLCKGFTFIYKDGVYYADKIGSNPGIYTSISHMDDYFSYYISVYDKIDDNELTEIYIKFYKTINDVLELTSDYDKLENRIIEMLNYKEEKETKDIFESFNIYMKKLKQVCKYKQR